MPHDSNDGLHKIKRQKSGRSRDDRPSFSGTPSTSAPALKLPVNSRAPTPATEPTEPTATLGDDWVSLSGTELSDYIDLWSSTSSKEQESPLQSFERLISPDESWIPAIAERARAAKTARNSSGDLDAKAAELALQQVAPGAKMVSKTLSNINTDNHFRSCLERLMDAALTLQNPEEACSPADSEPGQSDQRPENVDQILLRNRGVIKVLVAVLECRCASDEDVILACYLTLTRVVFCYGAVIENSELTAAPAATGIQSLSAQAKRAILARVVLKELQDQVKPLLRKLPRRTIAGASGAPGGQECALRGNIRAVVLKVDRIVRA